MKEVKSISGLPNFGLKLDEKVFVPVGSSNSPWDKFTFMSNCVMYFCWRTAKAWTGSVEQVRSVLVSTKEDIPLMYAHVIDLTGKTYFIKEIGKYQIYEAKMDDIKIEDVPVFRAAFCGLKDGKIVITVRDEKNRNYELWLRDCEGKEEKLDFSGGSDKEVFSYLKKTYGDKLK